MMMKLTFKIDGVRDAVCFFENVVTELTSCLYQYRDPYKSDISLIRLTDNPNHYGLAGLTAQIFMVYTVYT